VHHARLARPGLDRREYDVDGIERICRMVQGMPLALVLAAGWLDMLSFAEIAAEIAQSLDILERQAHDLPERQRSVRATFDYSWRRLGEAERRAFKWLSVFRGGFTRAAARAVAGADLRSLRTLVDKSFITAGEDRYEIHELLRQYAAELLRQSPEEAMAVEHGHARFFAGFALEAVGHECGRQRQNRILGSVEAVEVLHARSDTTVVFRLSRVALPLPAHRAARDRLAQGWMFGEPPAD
jgi:predicted ATPase